MAIYITQGRYTSDAIKGMVANPENREKAVADLMEKAGAKLLAVYFTFGEYDFLSITEAPSEEAMASALIAGASSGGISHLRTSVAMTSKDATKAFKSAVHSASHSSRQGGDEGPWVREGWSLRKSRIYIP
jgi:uncharacterized protein with GYD domain